MLIVGEYTTVFPDMLADYSSARTFSIFLVFSNTRSVEGQYTMAPNEKKYLKYRLLFSHLFYGLRKECLKGRKRKSERKKKKQWMLTKHSILANQGGQSPSAI